MVKVSGGAKSPGGVIKHLAYIDRQGELEIETDGGRRLKGDGIEKGLSSDWELEELSAIGKAPYRGKPGRAPREARAQHCALHAAGNRSPQSPVRQPRLCTRAVRIETPIRPGFAYGPGPSPRACRGQGVSEDGERLNIRKATLREWRSRFAEQLRHHGVSGQCHRTRGARPEPQKPQDRYISFGSARGTRAIYATTGAASNVRCALEGFSRTPARQRLLKPGARWSPGITAPAEALLQAGQADLARKILGFVGRMSPPRTADEHLVAAVARRSREARTVAPREYSR